MALKCTGRGRKSPLNRGVDLNDTDPPKKSAVAGQDISESGHMNESYQDGPKMGDLIRGEHLKNRKDGQIEDLDYNIQFEKDTSDVNGAYKIWKTTGIK
tara:strand:- start:328 stop:624 length:297 start_codon:yes stop_codon:yes gene_type:complete